MFSIIFSVTSEAQIFVVSTVNLRKKSLISYPSKLFCSKRWSLSRYWQRDGRQKMLSIILLGIFRTLCIISKKGQCPKRSKPPSSIFGTIRYQNLLSVSGVRPCRRHAELHVFITPRGGRRVAGCSERAAGPAARAPHQYCNVTVAGGHVSPLLARWILQELLLVRLFFTYLVYIRCLPFFRSTYHGF